MTASTDWAELRATCVERAQLIAALEGLSGITRTDEQIRRRLRELHVRAYPSRQYTEEVA